MGQQPSRVAAKAGLRASARDASLTSQAALPAVQVAAQPQHLDPAVGPPARQQPATNAGGGDEHIHARCSTQHSTPAGTVSQLERGPSEQCDPLRHNEGSIGEWLGEEVHARQAQLLAAEGDMQGALYEHYQELLQGLEPTLRLRGQMLGEALLDYMVSGSQSAPSTSYAQVLEQSASTGPDPSRAVQDAMEALDPLITPVLHPFVEGIKSPFYKEVVTIKNRVELGWVATGLACLLAGFVAGRALPGDGKRRR